MRTGTRAACRVRENLQTGSWKTVTPFRKKLLVLLFWDLEGQPVRLESIDFYDVDPVGSFLRVGRKSVKHADRVKLGPDTVKTFHDYTVRRPDNEPTLLVSEKGREACRPCGGGG